MDLKKYSNTQILQMLGLRFKNYRLMVELSQNELAQSAGVSVSTIHKFETGSITNMNIDNLMALLRPLGLLDRFDNLIPEQPVNPYQTKHERQQQRVRRKHNGSENQ